MKVYLATSRRGSRENVYHADEECKSFNGDTNVRETTKKAVEPIYRPCEVCCGG